MSKDDLPNKPKRIHSVRRNCNTSTNEQFKNNNPPNKLQFISEATGWISAFIKRDQTNAPKTKYFDTEK